MMEFIAPMVVVTTLILTAGTTLVFWGARSGARWRIGLRHGAPVRMSIARCRSCGKKSRTCGGR